MFSSFHSSGRTPSSKDLLNNMHREGEMIGAVSFWANGQEYYIGSRGFCSVKVFKNCLHFFDRQSKTSHNRLNFLTNGVVVHTLVRCVYRWKLVVEHVRNIHRFISADSRRMGVLVDVCYCSWGNGVGNVTRFRFVFQYWPKSFFIVFEVVSQGNEEVFPTFYEHMLINCCT
jgi:hypothetical protein